MAERSRFSDSLAEGLIDWGLEGYVYVPSSHIAPVIERLQEAEIPGHLANREEEGVGIAGGMALFGRRVALLLQDNGFGNALTALATFAAAYHIALPVVANTRGGLGEYNAMIHTFSDGVPQILRAAGLKVEELSPSDPPEMWRATGKAAGELCTRTHRPVVVLADLMHPGTEL
ncbi:MAG: thiamine pyrophosphate-binding protein [Actinomycetota bacterium]